MKNKIHFYNNEEDTAIIKKIEAGLCGSVNVKGENYQSIIGFDSKEYILNLSTNIDLDNDDELFFFSNGSFQLKIEAIITANKNNVNVSENWSQRYSEGKIYSIQSIDFSKNNDAFFRSYYKIKNDRFLNDFQNSIYETNDFSSTGLLELKINSEDLYVYPYHKDYLIIESKNKINYEVFTETSYNILAAIGFVSGNFIQNEAYTFQYENSFEKKQLGFHYQKLREESNSIYHAIITNPFSYENFIGENYADELYKNKTLREIKSSSLSKFVELIQNNNQIQYAIVLFNEANDNRLSLLVKNNSFYVVLEVLKKFLYDRFKTELRQDYSQKGNVAKYKIVLEKVLPLNENDLKVIKDRNKYLHGDIKDLEGREMIETMQMQLSLIYKVILKFVKMEVYVIDHYSIRKNGKNNSFIKLF